jgi:hypothetical protein
MSIMQRLKEVVGGKAADEPLTDYEQLTRAVVRTENLDWQGLPIDRERGAGMSPPKGFRKLVDYCLERAGFKIERRKPPGIQAVRGLSAISAIFNADAARQAAAPRRRPREDAFLRQGDAYSRPE